MLALIMPRLGAAVELAHEHAEALAERLEARARQRRPGREAQPQRGQVGARRRFGHQAEVERDAGEDRRPLALDQLQRPAAPEQERLRVLEDHDRRAGGGRREQAGAHALGVEHRDRAEDPVLVGQPEGLVHAPPRPRTGRACAARAWAVRSSRRRTGRRTSPRGSAPAGARRCLLRAARRACRAWPWAVLVLITSTPARARRRSARRRRPRARR